MIVASLASRNEGNTVKGINLQIERNGGLGDKERSTHVRGT